MPKLLQVCAAKTNSKGLLKLQIEHWDEEHPERDFFCFYDEAHVHPRLIISVEEREDTLWLEVLPF